MVLGTFIEVFIGCAICEYPIIILMRMYSNISLVSLSH